MPKKQLRYIVSNFQVSMRQEVNTWDIVNNLKYKVIGWHDLMKDNSIKVFDHINEWNGPSLEESTLSNYYAMVTPNYLSAQNKKLYDTIAIGQQNFTIGATGGDTLNIYPTIYDTDFIPNFKTDAVVYLSSYGMSLLAEDNVKGLITLKDNSRVFMRSLGGDKTTNLNTFQMYYANNPNQLDYYAKELSQQSQNTAIPSLGIFETKNQTNQLTWRYNLLAKTINIYIYIGLFFIIVFAITLLIVSFIIVKEMIKRESSQIGMLKAGGYRLREISLSYWSLLMITILIAVPLGWIVGMITQLFVIKLFNLFFIINWTFSWNWMILILLLIFFVALLSLITFITCFWSIGKTEVLSLIYPSRELKINTTLTRTLQWFHFKTFVGRFRMVILGTSWKQALTYLGIFALVTFTLTISLLAPTFAKNFNSNYYKNIKYSSEVKYDNVISNSPLSYYKTYEWQGIDNVPTTNIADDYLYPIGGMTPLANYYSIDGGTTIKPLKDVATETTIAGILKDMLSYNFTTLSGTNLSLGLFNYLNELVKASPSGDTIRALISEIVCTILPKALGIGSIPYPAYPDQGDYVPVWNACFAKATNGIIPAAVKETWIKNPDQANHFTLGIGTMSYNSTTDDFFTSFNTSYQNKALSVYGINDQTKMLALSANDRALLSTNNQINAIANVTALKQLNLAVGDQIVLTPQLNTLQYNIKNNVWNEFTNSAVNLNEQSWKYNKTGGVGVWNPANYESLYNLDKSNFTYNTSSNTKYYATNNKNSEYYNLNNVELWIPTNNEMEQTWSNKMITLSNGKKVSLLQESTSTDKVIRKETVDNITYWVIKPYDFNFDGPVLIMEILQVESQQLDIKQQLIIILLR